jgi:hypothetical protein
MEFTFNQEQVKERVQSLANKILGDIKDNMSRGIRETDIFIPKDILYDVCEIIEKETGDQFDWMVVKRDFNQYTGKPQSFTGMSMGDGTFYKKLCYYGN